MVLGHTVLFVILLRFDVETLAVLIRGVQHLMRLMLPGFSRQFSYGS